MTTKREVSTHIAESAKFVHKLMYPCSHDQIWQKKKDIPIDTAIAPVIYLTLKRMKFNTSNGMKTRVHIKKSSPYLKSADQK